MRTRSDDFTRLIRRYRTLCEANGLARANRVPLDKALQAEIQDLEHHLVAALDESGSRSDSDRTIDRPTMSAISSGRVQPSAAGHQGLSPVTDTAIVYTDGAAEGNPGPGGYCALVRIDGRPDRELSGGVAHTTNNKMELTAAIEGLKVALEAGASDISIYSDSEYLVKGMTQWLTGWKRKNWKTAGGQPVKNQNLWEQLAALSEGRRVTWNWVKGHAGHPENERCDRVASAMARQAARSK